MDSFHGAAQNLHPLASLSVSGPEPSSSLTLPTHEEIMRRILDPNELAKLVPEAEDRFSKTRAVAAEVCANQAVDYIGADTCFLMIGRGGAESYCTGTLLSPFHSSWQGKVVLTAGHCVFKHGVGWADYITVIPAFRVGKPNPTPFGAQTVYSNRLRSIPAWTDNQDFDYDLGAITLNERFRKNGAKPQADPNPLLGWVEMNHYPATNIPRGTMYNSRTQGSAYARIDGRKIFFRMLFARGGSSGGGICSGSPGVTNDVRAVMSQGATDCQTQGVLLYQEFINLLSQWELE